MIRLLVFVLGMLTANSPTRRQAVRYRIGLAHPGEKAATRYAIRAAAAGAAWPQQPEALPPWRTRASGGACRAVLAAGAIPGHAGAASRGGSRVLPCWSRRAGYSAGRSPRWYCWRCRLLCTSWGSTCTCPPSGLPGRGRPSELHNSETSNETELEYRLAWARTYLKNFGILERSGRGVWAIKADKQSLEVVDPTEVNRYVHALSHAKNSGTKESDGEETIEEDIQDPESPDAAWRQTLHRVLTTTLDPAAFERLTMRLLRESGFVHAEVTGKSGDGGIDGKGIARMAGVLSFHVVFQCKRYQGAVTASQMRDFRGAMVGRADKGLLITTGRFTRDAIAEATREGAPPIDLIDGDRLADMLKALKLGVCTEVVERVIVDETWLGSV